MQFSASDYPLIDTHCHLYEAALRPELGRWMNAYPLNWIVPGYDLDSSQQAVALASQAPHRISAAVGVHPHWASTASLKGAERALRSILSSPSGRDVVAIGEIGLDFRSSALNVRTMQHHWLVMQIALANAFKKPVLLHVVRAHTTLLSVLRTYPILKTGILHRFTGYFSLAKPFLDQGFYVSVGLEALNPRMLGLQETIRCLPLNQLFIESDAPYPEIRHYDLSADGWKSLPVLLQQIYCKIAAIRGLAVEELAQQIEKNYKRFLLNINR